VDSEPPWAAYVDALLVEWDDTKGLFSGAPDTIFLGGGTPSLMPTEHLTRLINHIGPTKECEVTLEANPGTVDINKLREIRSAGVNRLSMGIQTFQPHLARFLNRGHSVANAQDLLRDIKSVGFNSWSADLIFGLPNQTIDELKLDLEELLASEPPHISLYSLTAEPGTPYTNALNKGKFSQISEPLWEQMMELVINMPAAAGIQRYEVSNLAAAGMRCRHNELYWRGGHWAGLGVGAHGWLPNGVRTENSHSVTNYINAPKKYLQTTRPTTRERATELLLTSIRHVDGVPLQSLHTLGWALTVADCKPLINGGLVEITNDSIKVIGRGWNLINQVVLHLDQKLSRISHGVNDERK
jgi:oxygen-independent coproporphyrinogen-3 oxidase